MWPPGLVQKGMGNFAGSFFEKCRDMIFLTRMIITFCFNFGYYLLKPFETALAPVLGCWRLTSITFTLDKMQSLFSEHP